ncbi:MAG: hypothetical protein HQL69_08275 [Magnetococcales bacterium]|nr:hypothetical protein [Magnetococcales bacterium]
MDKTLVKILNMATSSSFEESNIAIEQAYRMMKKQGKGIEDIQFNSLYNGNLVAIKMIARFAHEHTEQKDRGEYINNWASSVYGSQNGDTVLNELSLKNSKNSRLESELESLRDSLKQSQEKLLKEQQNVKKYINLFRKKHGECMELLEKVETSR